ncbi:AAA family ATPase [Vibrio hippocampi]|uniref:Thrombospondin n=1 Tax=Vibrio hippocampi TaxID=654686 RepID=A0ABN8DKC7_9VIBR|nr:AAA family ATPase [Vibrio hippocampi]CAH0526553.1 hypothetical protein VHP8226_01907 [Vibrio hippocampi]
MKPNKISLSLGLAGIVALAGCSDSDSESSTSNSGNAYSIKAIDGYLQGAEVWLDLNSDFVKDADEPSATSDENGDAVLTIPNSISDPTLYPVVVKAIANQTVDIDHGVIKTDFVMSAPAGETDVTPLSTLVHVIINQTGASTDDAQAKQDAIEQVAEQLGIDSDKVLGDFIADEGKEDAAFAASAIVASKVLPQDSEDLMDEGSVLDGAERANANIKKIIDDVNQDNEKNFDGLFDPDTDTDQDGVPDVVDAFPDDAREQYDLDGDGTGDNADLDDDNDGTSDVDDLFPTDPTESLDTDGDGVGNNTDTDDDGDGYLDANDAYPLDATLSGDLDNDGVDNLVDEFPNDGTRAGDSDSDGVDDLDDAFPDDGSKAGDRDQDGYDDLVDEYPDDGSKSGDDDNDGVDNLDDWAPQDPNESADSDNDGLGNNADDDDDNDGVKDEFDSAPEDDTQGNDNHALTAQWLYNQSQVFALGSDDESSLLLETFDVNGYTVSTSAIEQVLATGELLDLGIDYYRDYVLTVNGWTSVSAYSIRYADSVLTAYPTDAPNLSYRLTGELMDLAGMNVGDYIEDIWSSISDDSAEFSTDSFVAYFDITPEQDIYTLWSSRPYLLAGDGGMSDGYESTSLDDLITGISAGDSVSTGVVKAVMIGDEAAVELVSDGTANYYTMGWSNTGLATIDGTSTWTRSTMNGEEVLTFTVPNAVINEWGERWYESSATLLYGEMDDRVLQGAVRSADMTLEGDKISLLSESVKEQILAIADIPRSTCYEGDTDEQPTFADFENSIAACGGIESEFTPDMLEGMTFQRFRSDGSSREYTFAANGDLNVAKSGIYAYTDSWSIENGYVKITDDADYVWYLALMLSENSSWSLKTFEEWQEDGQQYSLIWSTVVSQYDMPVCAFPESENQTETDFLDTLATYEECTGEAVQLTEDDLAGKTLMRTNSRGEIRAYEFSANDDSGIYYQNAAASGRFGWRIEDNNRVELYSYGSPNDVWSVVILLGQNDSLSEFIVHYSPQDMEVWSDDYYDVTNSQVSYCAIGDTMWDDENDIPLTTGSFDDYLEAVNGCREDTGTTAWFSNEFFELDYVVTTFADTGDGETYQFLSDGTGQYSDGEQDFSFTWEIDSENDLLVVTIEYGDLTSIDYMALVETNGTSLSLKNMSKANAEGWPGIGEDDEGDIWGNIYHVSLEVLDL